MAGAGLLVEGLFSAAGLIPKSRPETHRRDPLPLELHHRRSTSPSWPSSPSCTGCYRHRDRLGGGQGYAIDPICGMQVRTANAPARTTHAGQTYWFCCDGCREHFEADPARHAASAGPSPG